MRKFREKYIGNKDFYKMVLLVAIPIMIQNAITNFVSLLDNIMVGLVGTEQMSGVAIINQLMLVYNICIFGAVSGAGIFGTQFYGKGDHKGVRDAFRFKIVACGFLAVIWMLILGFANEPLIRLFLHEGGSTGDIEATLLYAKQYLQTVMPSMVPFALIQAYAQTLRETGETVLPMKAGIASVAVNLMFDYVLIFGAFGLPALGVRGAAAATVLARVVECIIVVLWTHARADKNHFIVGAYRDFKIPGTLVRQIIIKGTPLLLNETLWAGGMAVLMQCYSTRGLAVVAGFNISNTVANLFNVVFIALGSAISIIVGQQLGAGKLEEAVDTDRKMIVFSVFCCFVIGACMFAIAPFFPRIYNTTEEVRGLAKQFIRIASACMPLYGFMHATYFTLRSGGRTVITFLFDSVYIWVVDIPLAFVLTRFTGVPIVSIYLSCQLIEIIKCIIGYVMVKKKIWVNNMVMEQQ